MKKVFSNVLLAASLGLATFASAQAADELRPDAKHGEALYNAGDLSRGITTCIACHGPAGVSLVAMYPHLAGQHYSYIVEQLKNFHGKDGKGPRNEADAPLMAPNAAQMTEQDMMDLAAYISKLPLTNPSPAVLANQRDVVIRGRDIWRAGIPDRKVPACASCHGATGKGIPGLYPSLSGQHPEYLEKQLIAFADGLRTNGGAENQMGTIANRMSRADIKAVADYAAGIR